MTLLCVYFSPTTPTAATFSVDVTSAIRLGSITGLAGEAELGAVGTGNIVLDDPDSTLGHLGDGIVGLKQMFFDELDCPIGNQRLWTGYIMDRRYHRGQSDSLITGAARKIDVTLVDVNSFLMFRVFPPTADDPTSDFNRPAETDIARITALLTDVDFLSDTLFDDGYINTVGPVNLDANDYTGSHPQDVLNDCAQMSGKNYFIFYNEATGHYTLWYDKITSDGSDTRPFDSTLSLTNVLSEYDGSTVFVLEPDATLTLDPSRVISSIRGTGTGVTGYRTLATTANTFAWRDGTPISNAVKTQPKMDALLDRYLIENSTEDARISCTVRLPSSKVTAIREGMRIQLHATHLPLVSDDFTWCRILQRTIRQDQETNKFYWLELELSPTMTHTCSTSSMVDPFSDELVLDPYSAGGIDYSIPAPSIAPSVMFAAAAAAQGGTSIWYDISIGSPWTTLDAIAVAGDPGDHLLAATAYMPTPVGTPPDLNLNWDKPVEASTGVVATTIVTTATSPVQHVAVLDASGTGTLALTLSSPVTSGNMLALAVINNGTNTPAIPVGWTEIVYRDDMPSGGGSNPISLGIWLHCCDGSEGDTITLPGNAGHNRQAFLSEWAIS